MVTPASDLLFAEIKNPGSRIVHAFSLRGGSLASLCLAMFLVKNQTNLVSDPQSPRGSKDYAE